MNITFSRINDLIFLTVFSILTVGCELDLSVKKTDETVSTPPDSGTGGASCGEVASGATETRTRYLAANVVSPDSCQAELQVRVCNDGVFSDFNGSFTNASCTVASIPDGGGSLPLSCGAVASGESQTRVRFQAASVIAPAQCVSENQSRLCSNGVFSAYSGSFTNANCSVQQPPVEDLSRVSDGTYKNFDLSSTQSGSFMATFNISPRANNIDAATALAGATVSTYNDMAAIIRFNPAGQIDVRNGSNYSADSVLNYEANKVYQVRMEVHVANHSYSVFVIPDGAGEVTLASNYAFRSQQASVSSLSKIAIRAEAGTHALGAVSIQGIAAPQPLSCGNIANGGIASRVRYQADLVAAGQTCVSQTQTATCNNGVLGSYNGSYTFLSCEVQAAQPLGCGNLASGESETIMQYTAASVPAGSSCQQVAVTRSCSNGVLSASPSNTFASCAAEPSSGDVGQCSTISQFGITWEFATQRPCGKYANGDNWVVGPVVIKNITPASVVSGGRTLNGSMINPAAGEWPQQGFDSSMAWDGSKGINWNAGLNVARPGGNNLSASNPLNVSAGKSLVSVKSHSDQANRPTLTDAAVLTVVSSAPAEGSFRPPYTGSDKTHYWNKANLNYGILKNFSLSGAPTPDSAAAPLERPWIEIATETFGRYFHPVNNQPDYGRDMAMILQTALLTLHVNYSNTQKEKLYVRLVQYGIDVYGAAKSGALWADNGGHNPGRKAPMVLAGLAFNDSNILQYANANTHYIFSEDRQTFYVKQSDVGRTMSQSGWSRSTYSNSDVGNAEWGEKHASSPDRDSSDWGARYRDVVFESEVGEALGMMFTTGAKAAWNYPAFFDYIDRAHGYYGSGRTPGFVESMWQNFRSTVQ